MESIDTLTPSNPTLSVGTAGVASPVLEKEEQGGLSSPSAVTLGSLTSAKPGEDLSGYLGLFSLQGRGVLVSTLHACSVGCAVVCCVCESGLMTERTWGSRLCESVED